MHFSKFTIEIYKDRSKLWKWRIWTMRGLAASSEGYARVGPMLRNLYRVTGILVHRVHELPERAVEAKYAHEHIIVGRIQPPIKFTVKLHR